MDRIKDLEKFVIDQSSGIKEDFEDLQDEFKETSDSVKDLVSHYGNDVNFFEDCKSILVKLVRMDAVLDDVRTWYNATTSSL